MSYHRMPIPQGYHHFKHWLDECGYYLFSQEWINVEVHHGCYSLAHKAKIKTASSLLLERITADVFQDKVVVYKIHNYESISLSKLCDTYWDQISEINNGSYMGNIHTSDLNGNVHLALQEHKSLFSAFNASSTLSSDSHYLIEKPAGNNYFVEAIIGLVTHFGWAKLLSETEVNITFENYLEQHYPKLSERQVNAILSRLTSRD